MILFTILLIVVLALVAIVLTAIAIGGSAFIIVFGDVIVCIIFLVWIMKKLINRKRR